MSEDSVVVATYLRRISIYTLYTRIVTYKCHQLNDNSLSGIASKPTDLESQIDDFGLCGLISYTFLG